MNENLLNLRKKIDSIDDHILQLLRDRIDFMEKIGEIKKQSSLSIRDGEREKKKMKIIEQKAKRMRLPLGLISQIWLVLFKQSEEIEK